MSKTFKILFFLRKPKNYKEGSRPIYFRLTIGGERFEMSTNRECDPEKWNSTAGRMKGTTESTRQLNSYLELFQSKVYDVQRELPVCGDNACAQAVWDGRNDCMRERGSLQKSLKDQYLLWINNPDMYSFPRAEEKVASEARG